MHICKWTRVLQAAAASFARFPYFKYKPKWTHLQLRLCVMRLKKCSQWRKVARNTAMYRVGSGLWPQSWSCRRGHWGIDKNNNLTFTFQSLGSDCFVCSDKVSASLEHEHAPGHSSFFAPCLASNPVTDIFLHVVISKTHCITRQWWKENIQK